MNDPGFDGGLLAALKGLAGPMIGTVLGMAWGLAEEIKQGRPFTRRMLLVNALTAGGLGVVVAGFGEFGLVAGVGGIGEFLQAGGLGDDLLQLLGLCEAIVTRCMGGVEYHVLH